MTDFLVAKMTGAATYRDSGSKADQTKKLTAVLDHIAEQGLECLQTDRPMPVEDLADMVKQHFVQPLLDTSITFRLNSADVQVKREDGDKLDALLEDLVVTTAAMAEVLLVGCEDKSAWESFKSSLCESFLSTVEKRLQVQS